MPNPKWGWQYRIALLLSTPGHHFGACCCAGSWFKKLMKNVIVWILSGDTVLLGTLQQGIGAQFCERRLMHVTEPPQCKSNSHLWIKCVPVPEKYLTMLRVTMFVPFFMLEHTRSSVRFVEQVPQLLDVVRSSVNLRKTRDIFRFVKPRVSKGTCLWMDVYAEFMSISPSPRQWWALHGNHCRGITYER